MIVAAFYLIATALFVFGLIWFLIVCVRDQRWGCATFLAILLIGIFAAGRWLYSRLQEDKLANGKVADRLRHARQLEAEEKKEEGSDGTEQEQKKWQNLDEEQQAELAQLLRETISVRSQTSYINIAIYVGFILIICALASIASFESRGTGIAVATVLFLVAGGLFIWAFKEGRPLFVANARGIEEHDVWLGKTVIRNRVAWSQVKSATYEETRSRVDFRASERNNPMAYRVSSRRLRLLDSAGNELMRISQPWSSDGSQSFEKLLRAVPGWAGCEVQEKTLR